MYELSKAMCSLQDASDSMQYYANDAVTQEKYRAALQVYTRMLQVRWDTAHEFLKNHQEVNDKIFKDALSYIDLAIDNANYELAECAIGLINTLKEKEPEFYSQYYSIMFGRK